MREIRSQDQSGSWLVNQLEKSATRRLPQTRTPTEIRTDMRNFIIGIVVAIITAWFIGFTTPGHRLLHAVGLTSACESGCS
jgi:hypothetical protein